MKLQFKNLIDATNFSNFASSLENSNIDLTCGRISVDAKSLIGVANLDFTKVYDVQFSSVSQDETDKFLEYVEPLKIRQERG